jgi:uncharacterized protein YcbX
MPRTVSTIATTPIKGFALAFPERVSLGADGIDDNRRFALVDANGERLRSTKHAWPCTVMAVYDVESRRLSMRFPDGKTLAGRVEISDRVQFDYHGTLVDSHVVVGAWADRLSALAGIPVRLVLVDRPGRMQGRPATIVSTASLRKLAEEAGVEVDPRRFRMLFHVDGCAPHEEDEWLGAHVRIGGAVVRVVERVERCVVTTRDPETGERDLDTLALLKRYRRSIDFGVRAAVVEPGVVHVGDVVDVVDVVEPLDYGSHA